MHVTKKIGKYIFWVMKLKKKQLLLIITLSFGDNTNNNSNKPIFTYVEFRERIKIGFKVIIYIVSIIINFAIFRWIIKNK
jgi:hypothetical protein